MTHSTLVPSAKYDHVIFEGDKLQISDTSALVLSIIAGSEIGLLPAKLIRMSLTGSYELVFNPLHGPGVIVLNAKGSTILNSFRTPTKIIDVIEEYSEIREVHIWRFIKNLIAFRILVSENQPPKNQNCLNTLSTWLHVSNECNLNCDYCYISKSPEKMNLDTGKRSIDAIFRSADAHGFRNVLLKYAGGEPTLNFPLITTTYDYAIKQGEKFGRSISGAIISNGVTISEQMIEELVARNIQINISLDGIGHDNDLHRRLVNGKGSFKQVERTLNRLVRLGVTPNIIITVSQRTVNGLPDIVRYLNERDLPFSINLYRNNENTVEYSDLSFDNDSIVDSLLAAFSVNGKSSVKQSLLTWMDWRFDLLSKYPCRVCRSFIVIDQNGRIAKCPMAMEETVTDITSPDPLKDIKETQIGIQNVEVDIRENCRECIWRYRCRGGCPVDTYRMTGRYDAKSPNCAIYKALLPEIIRLEGLRILHHSEMHEAENQPDQVTSQ